jgi:hypothetical protein
MNNLSQFWDKFKYRYLSLILLSCLFAALLAGNDSFNHFIRGLGTMEYIGAFVAGILFVSSFTVPISAVLISLLAQDINPLALGLIGGVGATIGDLLIFRYVRNNLSDELASLLSRQDRSHLKTLIRSPYIAWILPLLGGLIIASPLPDELGVSLLSLANISETKLMAISYLSNSLGILAIASIAKVF